MPKNRGKPPPKEPTGKQRPLQMAKAKALPVDPASDVTPIVEFLTSFMEATDPRAQLRSRLISMKIPVPLLDAFKSKCELAGIPYQTMIKRLMLEWLKKNHG